MVLNTFIFQIQRLKKADISDIVLALPEIDVELNFMARYISELSVNYIRSLKTLPEAEEDLRCLEVKYFNYDLINSYLLFPQIIVFRGTVANVKSFVNMFNYKTFLYF